MNKRSRYPRSVPLSGDDVQLRMMRAEDEKATLEFANELPLHDLLYVRRDITNPKVVTAWIQAVADKSANTVMAIHNDKIVGCGALFRDPLSWSPHLGELRVLVSPAMRHKGLGRVLIQECFLLAIEHKLRKLTAHMTVDQVGAVAIFEELGFRGEALLKEHVMDRNGNTHDIVILSCDTERVHKQISAYGIDSAI